MTLNTPVDSRLFGPTYFETAVNRQFVNSLLPLSQYFYDADNDEIQLKLLPRVDPGCQWLYITPQMSLYGIPPLSSENKTCNFRVQASDMWGT